MFYNFPEHRLYERYGRDERIECRPVDGHEFVSARLLDCSRGGVFIELERLLPPGLEVVLKPAGCRPESVGDVPGELVTGVVIWSRAHGKKGSGGFGSGIRFPAPREW